MFPKWLWSIANAFGSVTAIDFRFASPCRVLRSNRRLGLLDRFEWRLPPSSLIDIRGLKPSAAQLTAWKGEENAAEVPWSPIPSESTLKFEQLVGLTVKRSRSMLTWIERIRIGIPPM